MNKPTQTQTHFIEYIRSLTVEPGKTYVCIDGDPFTHRGTGKTTAIAMAATMCDNIAIYVPNFRSATKVLNALNNIGQQSAIRIINGSLVISSPRKDIPLEIDNHNNLRHIIDESKYIWLTDAFRNSEPNIKGNRCYVIGEPIIGQTNYPTPTNNPQSPPRKSYITDLTTFKI